MKRGLFPLLLLLTTCGDSDRVCLNGPCKVPGKASDECLALVKCAHDLAVFSPESYDSAFGSGGSCWNQGQAVEDACTANCRFGLTSLRSPTTDAGCPPSL